MERRNGQEQSWLRPWTWNSTRWKWVFGGSLVAWVALA